MTAWWNNLPSLTPLKGFARFLYVYTHRETISEELKKRDERPKAIEEAARQLLNLEHERHEAEKVKLSRQFKETIGAWSALAERSDKVLDRAMEQWNQLQDENTRLLDSYIAAIQALAVMLIFEDDIREHILARLPAATREAVSLSIERLRELR